MSDTEQRYKGPSGSDLESNMSDTEQSHKGPSGSELSEESQESLIDPADHCKHEQTEYKPSSLSNSVSITKTEVLNKQNQCSIFTELSYLQSSFLLSMKDSFLDAVNSMPQKSVSTPSPNAELQYWQSDRSSILAPHLQLESQSNRAETENL